MEDLREEPELEEEEQNEAVVEEDEEDEESETEPVLTNTEISIEANGKPQVLTRPSEPVRSSAAKNAGTGSLKRRGRSRKALLQTNFSVTGLNEIKTESIPTDADHHIVLQCDITADNCPPMRPVSLHLNSTFTTFKPPRPGSMVVEKVTTKMIDPSSPGE